MSTLERITYQKLFATPFFRFAVKDAGALNKALLATGARLRAQTDGVAKSNRGGWHSAGNLFRNDADCIQQLQANAKEAVLQATAEMGAKADLDALGLKLFAWMNANPQGGYNAPHTHPGAHWSGVYYVSQPEVESGGSGRVEFLDPRTDLPSWRLLDAPAFRPKKAIRPAAGEIILFPSYLVHWVYPNDTDEERVTIAFNATFKKPRKPGGTRA